MTPEQHRRDPAGRGQVTVTVLLATALLVAGCSRKNEAVDVLETSADTVDSLSLVGEEPTVLVFTKTDCPISNRYAPTLIELQKRFATRGVRFVLVYPDPDDAAEDIDRHMREYGYSAEYVRDPAHRLVGLAGATVTPEAAVYARRKGEAKLFYRGRIDDRFVEFGTERREATTRDLADALEALLEDKAIETARTVAIGCSIPELE